MNPGSTFAALTGNDRPGHLWVSPLIGQPGFLRVLDSRTVEVARVPARQDPLYELPVPQQIGLIALNYERRRRFRLNGTLAATNERALRISVDEAFGNCPQFIPQRTIDSSSEALPTGDRDIATSDKGASSDREGQLTREDLDIIRRADTFILGTSHPQRGSDASHRGGLA